MTFVVEYPKNLRSMTIKEVKSKVKKAVKQITTKPTDLPYAERLALFSEQYKLLSIKYGVDFTIMPIDLKRVYQEGGVNKLRPEELPVIE